MIRQSYPEFVWRIAAYPTEQFFQDAAYFYLSIYVVFHCVEQMLLYQFHDIFQLLCVLWRLDG
jgi:hypothetical protein